ncbi:type IX secretion system sortase PorU [Melioribacteraceae bacterium 4301-Me]|uniref:type IX secretion system sortase PorU n=1 Tax=Pyranulibacter aquaticus TaxID=3163344 RepID=UPI00359A3217
MKAIFSIIFLLLIFSSVVLPQDVKVISSSSQSITILYSPQILDTTLVTIKGQKYYSFNLANGTLNPLMKAGSPLIPFREVNIGVPDKSGNRISINSVEYKTMQGQIKPAYVESSPGNLTFTEEYLTTKFNNVVSFGDYGLVRNLPVQTVRVYPIQFDASSNQIRVYSKIIFTINFALVPTSVQLIRDQSLSQVVLNWPIAKNWGVPAKRALKISDDPFASNNNWYRFEAPTEGIYRIDRNTLQSMGIDPNSVDPRTIKIYNNGGYQLPENPDVNRPNKLNEIAIYVSGEQDGKFDQNDYILFYGRGTEFWEYSNSFKKIVRVKNPFSKKNYYWITAGGNPGKRMNFQPTVNANNFYSQLTTLAFKQNDKDSTNIGHTGRDYFGDELDFNTKSRVYLNTLDGIVPGSKIYYQFRVANISQTVLNFLVSESNTLIYSSSLPGSSPASYYLGTERIGSAVFNGTLTDNRSSLKFAIETSASNARLAIDYFEITYTKYLQAFGDQILFFSRDTTANIQFGLSNFSNSNILIFDVTDYANVSQISNAHISGGQCNFQISAQSGNVRKFLAVTETAFQTPVNIVNVQTTNLKADLTGTEFIIISDKSFKAEAERLRDYKNSQSPSRISTSLYYVDDIYNQFSCGSLDPSAIRDFLKFAYDNWQVKPFYVLLFGDGSYDYYNTEKKSNNFIPAYETKESLYEINSYPTDDFYARVSGSDLKADLAIGRLPVQNLDDAKAIVDKIIAYETKLDMGLWRNTITLVADDGPAATGVDDGSIHTSQSENLSRFRIPSFFDQNKIYLALYPTVYTGLGRRKPAVNQAIIDAINNGTLILNFIGHGNPDVWTHESVFEKSTTIPQLKNNDYFFLTAATCDFGRYDDPSEQSSTELLVNKPNSGAIGAFTAARLVYSNLNAIINDSLYSNLFRTKDSLGLPIRIGKAYFYVKQHRTLDNDEKYHLFCDPTLRLDQPILPAIIDSVNHFPLNNNIQISALSEVNIRGSVSANNLINNFSGNAIVSVYDSDRQVFIKEMNYTVTLQGGLIYRGRVNVDNGIFQTGFVVPKDISYENKNGRIVSYIFNENNDGVGFTNKIIVGGTNPNAVNDGKGPNIEIYFDKISESTSNIVNSDFTLFVKLSDQTGLNTTGTGLGHKLEGILNGDENNPIDFSNYFISDVNSNGKSGVIQYKFTGFEPGDYNIKIKAWDVFNNLTTKESNFTVVSGNDLVIRNVVNYPNPFMSNTTFTFQHNLNKPIDVKIKIYTIAGRMIKEIKEDYIADKFVKIDWDGRDEDGNLIANGVYLYKLIVRSSDGQYTQNVLGKLAVIR